MRQYVIDLFHRAARSEQLAGGKASTLARLHGKGFPVPPGFVVATRVFDLLKTDIGGLDADTAADRFLSVEFPERISGEIRKRFRKLGGPVAVRSSLVGEDGRLASCAGQLDTFLNVEDEEDLFDAIRKCYRSIFGSRWTTYCLKAGDRAGDPLSGGRVSMAVLVQRMIPATIGGVAFTAEPHSGRVCTIIEAVKGTPEGVVAGRVRPDRYVVDSRGVLELHDVSGSGGGVLDGAHLQALASIARDLSIELEIPQDIEWAFDGSDFHILQSRPITPLAGKSIYSRKLAADMAPGLIKPLYWSTNILDMASNVFGRVFGEILGPGVPDPAGLVGYIHSRVFANVTLFAGLFARMGLPINLFEVLARGESAIHKRPRVTARFVLSAVRMLAFVLRHGWPERRAEAFLRRHRSSIESFRREEWPEHDTGRAMRALSDLRGLHGQTQWYMWTTAMCMMARRRILSKFLKRYAAGLDPRDLLAGYLDLKSLEPNEEIARIAKELRDRDPESIPVVESGTDKAIRESLGESRGGRAVLKSFDDFMDRYGHLSASGTDFTVPPWKEKPDLIWRSIGGIAAKGGHDKENAGSQRAHETRAEARARALGGMNMLSAMVFKRMLRGTLTYLKLRERVSFCMSEDAYQMRRVYLALGADLAAGERIDEADDVFYLMYDELENLLAGRMDYLVARERILERRAAMEADAAMEIDDIVCGDDIVPLAMAAPDDRDCLVGIPGSAGLAKGHARVVKDPYEFKPGLLENEILVVPFMDVGWTPLFSYLSAIVADTGGQLSHSAIIAREFGVPAVVSVRGATRLIKDGQPLTVDGNRGIVHLKHLD